MSVAALLREVGGSCLQEMRAAGQMPEGVIYQFGAAGEEGRQGAGVQKTRVRQVCSARYGRFQAREVVLRPSGRGKSGVHSQELRQVVPPHANYAFDVVAAVGWASLVEGCPLCEVGQALQKQDPALVVPASTLYDLKLRFLFYLEALHREAQEVLREYLAGRGGYTALVDGTCEGGSPVLLGVTEAEEEIVLGSWRIAGESLPEVEACLKGLREAYGEPKRGLHDLSDGIRRAWAAVFRSVPGDVCHFHFCADVGRDLCTGADQALRKELRRQKLQLRLHEQRKVQTRAVERAFGAREGEPTALQRLLKGEGVGARERGILGREVIIGTHQWILDYESDGPGRSFPFAPRVLFLHRRIVRAETQLRELVGRVHGQEGIPVALYHLSERLYTYVTDEAVVKAAAEYEEAWGLFNRLRGVLRLEATGRIPRLSDPCALTTADGREIREGLIVLGDELRGELAEGVDLPRARKLQIVLSHLEEYAPHLQGLPAGEKGEWERTTNKRERQWRQMRRTLRRTHGRSSVRRDLEKLPDALGLVPNLTNTRYAELVLGKPECLADRFAGVAAKAGSFAQWKTKQRPLRAGRLPLKELRAADILERVAQSYAAEVLGDPHQAP